MTPAERIAGVRALVAAGAMSDAALDIAIGGLYASPPTRSKAAVRQARHVARKRAQSSSSDVTDDVTDDASGDGRNDAPDDASPTAGDASANARQPSRAQSQKTSSSLLGSASEAEDTQSEEPPQPSAGTPHGDAEQASPNDASADAFALTTGNAPKAGSKADREARGTRCPRSDAASAEVATWLASKRIDALDSSEWGVDVAKFLDHHRARGTRSLDWAASWRTWKTNAKAFSARAGGYRATPPRVQGGLADLEAYQRDQAARKALLPDPGPIDDDSVPF